MCAPSIFMLYLGYFAYGLGSVLPLWIIVLIAVIATWVRKKWRWSKGLGALVMVFILIGLVGFGLGIVQGERDSLCQ